MRADGKATTSKFVQEGCVHGVLCLVVGWIAPRSLLRLARDLLRGYCVLFADLLGSPQRRAAFESNEHRWQHSLWARQGRRGAISLPPTSLTVSEENSDGAVREFSGSLNLDRHGPDSRNLLMYSMKANLPQSASPREQLLSGGHLSKRRSTTEAPHRLAQQNSNPLQSVEEQQRDKVRRPAVGWTA